MAEKGDQTQVTRDDELCTELHEHASKGGTAGPAALAGDKERRERQEQRGLLPRTRVGRCFRCNEEGHWDNDCPLNPANIAAYNRILLDPTFAAVSAAQQPDPQWTAASGHNPDYLINLIKRRLLEERLPQGVCRQYIMLCGAVSHFGGKPHDADFGCGYRNLQVQAMHAMQTSTAAKQALFAGAGFVPDISSLQAWIECAWLVGFDAQGAAELGQEVQGGKKWTGTCEAAVLLRYFGIDARIIDFGVVGLQKDGSVLPVPPIDHLEVACDACGSSPITGVRYKSQSLPNYDLCEQCHARPDAAAAGPFQSISPSDLGKAPHPLSEGCSPAGEKLVDWIWKYFSAGVDSSNVEHSRQHNGVEVACTGLPPLYLQQEGHSRTVVGIGRREFSNGSTPEYSLFILDPGMAPKDLHAALQSGRGWQRWLKRGAHTLQQSQFQVMYSVLKLGAVKRPGTAEYEALKVIAAAERF